MTGGSHHIFSLLPISFFFPSTGTGEASSGAAADGLRRLGRAPARARPWIDASACAASMGSRTGSRGSLVARRRAAAEARLRRNPGDLGVLWSGQLGGWTLGALVVLLEGKRGSGESPLARIRARPTAAEAAKLGGAVAPMSLGEVGLAGEGVGLGRRLK